MPGRTVNGFAAGEPSRKRQRRLLDEDDETVQVCERKRIRTSDVAPTKHEDSPMPEQTPSYSDDEDMATNDANENDEDNNDDDDESLAPQTQYEEMRDNGFTHLQHEQEDDQRATQRLKSRSEILGDNRIADNGILESITCINFMCHTRLHCDLGPLLNFIVGENGSGKSAILTAITLCLGGKASSTNRGGSLKSFVKEGQEHAILTVKIKNQGVDSYQHETFGDSIIIERHFSRSGSSGFKVKATTGRIISTKKSDVGEIVEYYCLQVDNPLNVLSQDNARQFLNASSAAMKYKFFIQGVQLEQLDKDYELVKEFLDANEGKLPEQEEQVRLAKDEHEAAEKLLKTIQNNQELRRKLRHYMNQLAWSQVVEQERNLAHREEAILTADAAIAAAEHKKDETSQLLELATEKRQRAQGSLEAVKADGADNRERFDRVHEEFRSAKKDLESIHTDERDVFGRLKIASNRVKDLDAKIKEERQRLENNNGSVHKEAQKRLDAARDQENRIRDEVETAQDQVPKLEEDFTSAREDVSKMAPVLDLKREEVTHTEAKIRALQQDRGSPYAAYEPQVPQLLKLIANDSGFGEKPVGPMGAYVRLLMPVWSSILEKTLGGILNGFIVTSKQDQQRLLSMMQRLNIQRCPIFIANRHPINTEGKEPDSQFTTILRVLKFDDDLVRNQLIINSNIEQVVLIEERKKAEDVMFSGPAPRNVVACLSLHDGKRGEGLRLANKGGSMSTTPVVPGNQKPRMKSDMDSQVAVLKDLLAQHGADLRALENQKRELQRKVQQRRAEVTGNRDKLEKLITDLRAAQVDIVQTEEELDKFDGADGRLRNLEQELGSAKGEQDQYGDQYGEIHEKKKEQNRQIEALKRNLDAEGRLVKDHDLKVQKAQDKVNRSQDACQIALVDKNGAFEEVDKCRDDKRIIEEKRDRQAAVVEEFVREATQVTPERVYIPDDETHAGVEKKLEAVKKQLEIRRKKVGMTDEEASLHALDAKRAYEQAEEVWAGTKGQISAIKQTLSTRLAKWRVFQRYISANSRCNFIYLLSERGFRGKLLLDHKAKKLQVQVEPDETKKSAAGRSTKTLSGGEKSFSSICLLLAIWEAMGSPLRCLDEFDVFMDNINRAISTNMLISAARRSVGRQYLLITPNAIEGRASLDKDVKIIRMTDPRQRTLADQ